MNVFSNHKTLERKYRPRGGKALDVVRQLNTSAGLLVDKYLLEVFRDQGFEFDPERDNRSVYDPHAMPVALEKYRVQDSLSYDSDCLQLAKKDTFNAFCGNQKLDALSLTSCLAPFIKLERSSGLPLATTKGAAFELDLGRAVSCVESGDPFPPCIAYHRIQFGESGPKTRLVWGYPLSATLVEAMFARPLIEKFKTNQSPMTLGYNKMELSAVTQHLRNSGLTYCLDFSRFDATVRSTFIAFAFSILKTHFRAFDEFEEECWRRIVSYFLHTTILMPDGFVWQKHGGIPSGSYFTQMVGSIVNYLATQYMSYRSHGSGIPRGWLVVLGDDSLFSMPFVSLDKLSAYASEIGLTVNAEKSIIARKSEAVHFLGHSWPHGVASRPVSDVLKRVVTSERWSNEPIDQLRVDKLVAFVGDCKEGSLVIAKLGKVLNQIDSQTQYMLYLSTRSMNDRATAHTGLARMREMSHQTSLTFGQTINVGLWLS